MTARGGRRNGPSAPFDTTSAMPDVNGGASRFSLAASRPQKTLMLAAQRTNWECAFLYSFTVVVTKMT